MASYTYKTCKDHDGITRKYFAFQFPDTVLSSRRINLFILENVLKFVDDSVPTAGPRGCINSIREWGRGFHKCMYIHIKGKQTNHLESSRLCNTLETWGKPE